MHHACRWALLGVAWLGALPFLRGANTPVPLQFKGATPLQWSVRLANSEMERRSDSLAWKKDGRAIGWLGMALVDTLDFFPTNHPARPELIATLQKLAAGVVRYQDPASGLWYQVMNQGSRQGNYLEATASSMFVYTFAKGINRGYLARDCAPAMEKGYRGLLDRLIRVDPSGQVNLIQCCSVAGLGNGRSGTFEYYVGEPIVENDLKGVGPFILAGIELQQFFSGKSANPDPEIRTKRAAASPSSIEKP
jgi:rhamnogalacturonyl hydrolase YesR